jgi:hypothetical protein
MRGFCFPSLATRHNWVGLPADAVTVAGGRRDRARPLGRRGRIAGRHCERRRRGRRPSSRWVGAGGTSPPPGGASAGATVRRERERSPRFRDDVSGQGVGCARRRQSRARCRHPLKQACDAEAGWMISAGRPRAILRSFARVAVERPDTRCRLAFAARTSGQHDRRAVHDHERVLELCAHAAVRRAERPAVARLDDTRRAQRQEGLDR